MSRLAETFARLKKDGRAAFVPFITACDPDPETSLAILSGLPGAGADIIELGMAFTDPMADGPAVQMSSTRALAAGYSTLKLLDMVKKFRKADNKTPIVLMGYFNPIHAYGAARFAKDAAAAGVDGIICVDLPPEEDEVLKLPAAGQGIDLVRLVTPTSDDVRLKTVVGGASGFLYYVSIAGVTGTKSFSGDDVAAALARVRAASPLPVCVGFGIRTPAQAAQIAAMADGVVVGSAIVSRIAETLASPRDKIVGDVLELCRALAGSTHDAKVRA